MDPFKQFELESRADARWYTFLMWSFGVLAVLNAVCAVALAVAVPLQAISSAAIAAFCVLNVFQDRRKAHTARRREVMYKELAEVVAS